MDRYVVENFRALPYHYGREADKGVPDTQQKERGERV